ncbi:hypothetical protein Mal48_32590 [Thalassoglobus polymorphus]|uniref:Uncharacterized protein n=1 Tax=Thalassoglobus polymorphus TaxID=2527994 RepID=A0A517QQU4_9PLAN|nr:hypothetical protein Mal48_32590 [Thalassoglobus polymorphus]
MSDNAARNRSRPGLIRTSPQWPAPAVAEPLATPSARTAHRFFECLSAGQ